MASMTPQMRAFNDVALAMFCGYYDEIVAKNSSPANGDELLAKLQELIYAQDQEGSIMEPHNIEMKPASTAAQSPLHGTRLQEQPDEMVSSATTAICGSDLFKKFPLKHSSTVLNDDGKQEEVVNAVDLPYLSCVDYSSTCQALKVNGGLLSPCLTRPAKGSSYCKTCFKADLKYGTIADRENTSLMCYQDPKGKKEISFGTYCAKRSIPREDMERQILELYNGLVLPEEQWAVDKTKASRPIKSSSSSSDGDKPEVDADAPKKKRGRPKKVVKVVEDVTTNDVNDQAEEKSVEVEAPEKPKKVKKAKKSKKATAEVEVSTDGELELEEPVQEEPVQEEPVQEEPVQKEPVQEPVQEEPVQEPANEEPAEEENGGDSGSESEDEGWTKIVYDGTEFLVDDEQTLWWETEDDAEAVGTWDPHTKTPTFMEGVDIESLKA